MAKIWWPVLLVFTADQLFKLLIDFFFFYDNLENSIWISSGHYYFLKFGAERILYSNLVEHMCYILVFICNLHLILRLKTFGGYFLCLQSKLHCMKHFIIRIFPSLSYINVLLESVVACKLWYCLDLCSLGFETQMKLCNISMCPYKFIIMFQERCVAVDTISLVARILNRSKAHLQSMLLRSNSTVLEDFYVHLVWNLNIYVTVVKLL